MERKIVRFDRQVGHRLLPGVQTCNRQRGTRYLLRTNSDGFRTKEFEPATAPGVRRVLFYGDSFTEGVGVSDGKRFTDVLERLLPNTEVLNFGVRATGTDQQLLFFRERPVELEYDLVVIGLFTADVKRNYSKYGVLKDESGGSFQKPFFTVEDDGLALQNVPVPPKAAKVGDLTRAERSRVYHRGLAYYLRLAVRAYSPWAKPLLQRLTRYQPAPFLKSPDDPAWLLTKAIVETWASEASAPVLILAIPPYHYIGGLAESDGYRDRFAELAATPGLDVFDPLDALRSAAKSQGADTLRLRGDAHFSEEGHRVLAESLAPVISDLLAKHEKSGALS